MAKLQQNEEIEDGMYNTYRHNIVVLIPKVANKLNHHEVTISEKADCE